MHIIIDSGHKVPKVNNLIAKNTQEILLPNLIVSTGEAIPEGRIEARAIAKIGSPITTERLQVYGGITPTTNFSLLRIATSVSTTEEAKKAGFYTREFADFLELMLTSFPELRLYSKSRKVREIIGQYLGELKTGEEHKRIILPFAKQESNHEFYMMENAMATPEMEKALTSGVNIICELNPKQHFDENKMVTTAQLPYVASRKGLDTSLWVITPDAFRLNQRIEQYKIAYSKKYGK